MAKIGWIGIDVGGTKTRADLFDDDFHILKSIKFKTPKEPDEFQQNLTNAVKKLVKKADSRLLIPGIGVGFAGSVNTKKGVIESAPNLPDLKSFSFKKVLGKLIRAEVTLHNDVHAAMYGELKLGAAVGFKHVLGVFLGTGIGGAIISNGN